MDGLKARYRILLVDDDPDLVEAMQAGLNKRGYRVFPYTDPYVALQDFSPRFYDIAILDVRMLPLDGMELHSKLRGLDPGLHVCFLTAYADMVKDRPRGIRFLQKPTSVHDLVAEIERMDGRASPPN